MAQKDYLKADPSIPGQEFTCISFLRPEDIMAKKAVWLVGKFMVDDVNRRLKEQVQHVANQVHTDFSTEFQKEITKRESSINDQDKIITEILKSVQQRLQTTVKELEATCTRLYQEDEEDLMDRYLVYRADQYERQEREFNDIHEGVPTCRGFKVRGSFATPEKAYEQAEFLRKEIEPAIDVWVAEVGKWLDPDADMDSLKESNYANKNLNELMRRRIESRDEATRAHVERRLQAHEDAADRKAENIRDKLRAKHQKKKTMQRKAALEECMAKRSALDAAPTEAPAPALPSDLPADFPSLDEIAAGSAPTKSTKSKKRRRKKPKKKDA